MLHLVFNRAKRQRALTVVAVAGALSMTLAACGGAGDSGSDNASDNAVPDSVATQSETPSAANAPDPAESSTPIVDREPTRVAKSFAKGITSDELLGWLEAAVGEMVDPPTDFMGLLWPVGSALDDEPDPSAFDGAPFSEHAAVLDDSEIDEVAAFFADWQSGLQGCEPEEIGGFDEGAQRVERWIRGGADVATAPDPCLKSRSAVLAWTDNQDKETARHIFFHEAYHGLSNYLLRQCAPILNRAEDSMDHLRWFAEGTADYFSLFMQSQQDGRDDYEQRILERAQLELQGDPGMTMASNTYLETAGILLLIKRGLVSHEKVIDGSYFTNCDWIETFDPSQPEVKFAFDNFGQIESVDGEFAYPDEVING